MPLSRDVETDPHPAALLFTDVQNDNAGPDGGGGHGGGDRAPGRHGRLIASSLRRDAAS